jgi:lipoprotein Spr
MKNVLIFIFPLLIAILFSVKGNAQYSIPSQQEGPRLNTGKFIESIEINSSDKKNKGYEFSDKELKPISISSSVPYLPIENLDSWQFKYALLLNREVESITDKNLFSLIDEWMGTRYHYGGQTKSGIDCSAFSGVIYKQLYQIDLPRTAREQYAVCTKLERSNLKLGDLLFFNTRGGVSHVGYYLGGDYFVHASTKQGVVISSLREDYYSTRFISGGRVPINAN